jgi:hypothetical protein
MMTAYYELYNRQAHLQLAYTGQTENVGLPAICTFEEQ